MRGTPFDFVEERRAVVANGRRFLVRKPRVYTVLLLRALFQEELLAIARRWKEARETFGSDPEATIIGVLQAVRPGDFSRVLATVASIEGMDEVQVQQLLTEGTAEAARAIAAAAVGLCNIERIVLDMDLVDKDETEDSGIVKWEDPREPHAMTAALVNIWKTTGTPIGDILSWPYEGLLTVLDTLAWLARPQSERPEAWLMDSRAADLGIAYERAERKADA